MEKREKKEIPKRNITPLKLLKVIICIIVVAYISAVAWTLLTQNPGLSGEAMKKLRDKVDNNSFLNQDT